MRSLYPASWTTSVIYYGVCISVLIFADLLPGQSPGIISSIILFVTHYKCNKDDDNRLKKLETHMRRLGLLLLKLDLVCCWRDRQTPEVVEVPFITFYICQGGSTVRHHDGNLNLRP